MAWARDQTEELRQAQSEVDQLRDEEEQQCLGKVSQDACTSENLTGKVAERIAHKDTGRISGQRQPHSKFERLAQTCIVI